jgi:phospholipid/cholesterol/gamma-HCH transport system substrate-binding protein
METRARYILVGAFTLFSLLAALGFILWLAKVEIDRTFAQYDILFDTVAGLGQASAVRYNGVDVGTVLAIELDRADPSLVRVRIEVAATTPIRVDTMATLASQGVTGVSFVALEGGQAESERLVVEPPNDVPVIPSEPSVVQGLITDAPDLLAEAIALMEDIRGFTTPDNRTAIADILKNVESATARIDSMAAQTDTVMAQAEATLTRADAALEQAEKAFASANTVIEADVPDLMAALKATMTDVSRSAQSLADFSTTGLPRFSALAQEARTMVGSIRALSDRISSDPARFLLGNQTPAYRN